jgi:molybdenum cofactor guanylyltransferase
LKNSEGRPALIVACDLPFVSSELLKLIVESLGDFNAAVPLDSSGRLQPLCAAYSPDALGEVTRLITNGKRKVSELLEAIPVRLIEFSDLSQLRGSSMFFHNVNTPKDLAQARAWLEQLESIR